MKQIVVISSSKHKKSKSKDLDFFICAAGTTSFDRRSTSFRAQREHHSAFMRTQTNDVALRANDGRLRINDVALRANGLT